MTPDAGLLATLLCRCGSDAVVAIAPGHPAEISTASDIMVRREVPIRGMRLRCWPALARKDLAQLHAAAHQMLNDIEQTI